ncbi:MAG: ABC transporter ATP-binding protein [Stappia sp.]|uniref:ABC transporter ATP-binding protein n=1 Tax=Stappia sp. TaxID=1870903 RepID=UPI000C3F084D|nr:ABC transporter ATP-binding protein [Stappia sp.]MAB00413.1 ABC transporter ATP-binding protein [Stappia sp.]MBM19828.1 ABC transporter ATP-binding protein [Stappia sp.]
MNATRPASEPATGNAPADDWIIEAHGLSKSFGGFYAVQDLDLKVQRNTIHALIGPNGAGKTTVFNLLTKLHQPTSGKVLFNGRDVTRTTMAELARLGMVRSFQISSVFSSLTVFENVRIALQRKSGLSARFWLPLSSLSPLTERADELIERVGLSEWRNKEASSLPYGRRRALELATTLALDPEMLLLDEPLAGMGHEDIDRVADLIRRIARDRTILMVEHNLPVVAHLSDHITVLARGQVLAEGSYAEVSDNPKVLEAYIGGVAQ